MTLLLPLSSGQWNPCTYARPFVQPRAVVEGTQDPQTIFDTVLEHCGVKADKNATFLVGERHRYIPNSEGGARHKLGAIENHRVKRVFFLGVDSAPSSSVFKYIQRHGRVRRPATHGKSRGRDGHAAFGDMCGTGVMA